MERMLDIAVFARPLGRLLCGFALVFGLVFGFVLGLALGLGFERRLRVLALDQLQRRSIGTVSSQKFPAELVAYTVDDGNEKLSIDLLPLLLLVESHSVCSELFAMGSFPSVMLFDERFCGWRIQWKLRFRCQVREGRT